MKPALWGVLVAATLLVALAIVPGQHRSASGKIGMDAVCGACSAGGE